MSDTPDIVERLRKGTCIGGKPMDALAIAQGMADAADEIDRLEIDRDAWRLAFKDMVELKTQAVQRAETAEAVIAAARALKSPLSYDQYGVSESSMIISSARVENLDEALAAHDKAMK